MFVVIVSTVSTGRVRRKQFARHEKAQKYADRWRAEGRRYCVEVTATPATRVKEAPAGVPSLLRLTTPLVLAPAAGVEEGPASAPLSSSPPRAA